MKISHITIVILTKNNENTLERTLKSASSFQEIILIDSGSIDGTLEIARNFPNVRIFKKTFTNFGNMRNFGASKAQNDWIFALDSDEVITKELLEELSGLSLDQSSYFRVPSRNFVKQKEIRYCGWYPDYKNRLYNKATTSFKELAVHEDLNLDGLIQKTMANPLLHYSYSTLDQMLSKMNTYSTLFAKEYSSTKSGGILKAYFRSLWTFIKIYFFKCGFLDGMEGYLIALTQSHTTFYKYLKLALTKRGSMDAEEVMDHILEEDESIDTICQEEADVEQDTEAELTK